ncbi:unnamed protein product [Oreochromis niloticus]|nr:unnamed protein product [Mustela putorius furo]
MLLSQLPWRAVWCWRKGPKMQFLFSSNMMSSNASLSTNEDNDDIIITKFVLYTVTVVLGITGNAVVIWMAGIKLEFHGFFKHTNMFCSVFLLAVISLDRVLCVRQPILMKRRRTLFAARVVAVCVWIIALLFSIPYFTFRKIYMDNNNQTKCKMVWVEKPKENKNTKVALYSTQFIFSFIFPFMVILICYILVGLGLRRTRLSGKSRPLRILVCLVIAFFLCWAPYQCLLLVDIVYNENKVVKKWYSITKSIAYFNSCVNLLLYFCMGLKVKEGFRQKLMRVYKRALGDDMDGQMAQPTDPSLD